MWLGIIGYAISGIFTFLVSLLAVRLMLGISVQDFLDALTETIDRKIKLKKAKKCFKTGQIFHIDNALESGK